MAGRNMALDVLVRLKDLMSGPLKRLQGVVKGFTDAVKKIGLVGGAIAAISFTAPIAQAAEFQQKLLDIAGTADLSGKSAFNFVAEQKKMFEGLALATGLYSDTIADGAGLMTAAGLNQGDITGSLGGIARATRAANADFKDMSSVATASIMNLKIPAAQVEDALAALIKTGKLGSFEMKNMARYFPTLTSQAASLGIVGREAINSLGAALQIAMKGTSDPSEAANNLKNFMSKLKQPVTQKAFKEAGVDLNAVMMNAAAQGINPMEAVVKKIMDLTGISNKEIAGFMEKAKANGLTGAEALAQLQEQLKKIYGGGKLGELFQDQQVMDFLTPMLANIEEYKRIKEAAEKAAGPDIMKDFETQMQGLQAQFTRFQELGVQAIRTVGEAFGTWLPKINDGLESLIQKFRAFNESTGGLGLDILSWGGGAVLLAGSLGVIGIAVSAITAGFSALIAIGGAIAGFFAAITAPVWLTVAAFAAVGAAIWYFRKQLGALIARISAGIDWGALMPTGIADAWNALATAIEKVIALAKTPFLLNMKPAQGGPNVPADPNGGTIPSDGEGKAKARGQWNFMNGFSQFFDGRRTQPEPAQLPAPTAPPPPQKVDVQTTVTVKAAPGTSVLSTNTKTSGAATGTVNTGKSVGAP